MFLHEFGRMNIIPLTGKTRHIYPKRMGFKRFAMSLELEKQKNVDGDD
jgi:hypothetical protein